MSIIFSSKNLYMLVKRTNIGRFKLFNGLHHEVRVWAVAYSQELSFLQAKYVCGSLKIIFKDIISFINYTMFSNFKKIMLECI